MSPNNSLADENDDSINDMIDQIKNIVINENRCLSYTHVSQRFGVRVDIARNILKRFVSQHANDGNTMSVKYFLCGNNNNDDDDEELKIERFLIVDECELDSTRAMFKNLVVEDIYSVAVIDKDGNVPKFELNFTEYESEVTNESQLKHIQSLTFKRNDSIGFRNIRRRGPPLPVVKSESDVELEDKSESKTKSQFTKVKTNKKRKNNIKSMFSNNSKNVKREVVEEEPKDETNVEDNDPFKSDSEDDIKEVCDDTVEQQKPKIETEDREETMSLKEEEVIEVINEIKNVRNKRGSKEQNISSEEEDDEEEIIVTKTKKSKRFKRIRVISDSDEDEDKEDDKAERVKQKAANNLHLIASAKKDELKPVVKRVEVQETHVDDDGFTVTKTVKKDVVVDENENCDYIKPKPSEKQSNGMWDNKANTKVINKRRTISEPKKSKSLKDTSNMKQMSITNFFKPKVSA